MSDNYHQPVQGGTGANHIMLGTADALYFSDGNGHAQTPPDFGVDPNAPGTPLPGKASALSEIENPDPQHAPIISISRMAMAAAKALLPLWRPTPITAAAPTSIVPTRPGCSGYFELS